MLLAIDFPPESFEVIVIDDAMDTTTAELVESLRDRRVRIELLRQNRRGAAAARNAGARIARGEVLLFCDDDMIVQPDHVKLHLATRAAYGDALIGGTRRLLPTLIAVFETSPFGRFRLELERRFSTDPRGAVRRGGCFEAGTLPACDLSVARDTFWRLGGFDESFPFAGAEDQDLSARAAREGLRLIRNYDIKSLHDDARINFRQLCQREERGSQTMVPLGRKFPEYLGDFRKNGPITRDDPPAVAAKKLVKFLFSRAGSLAVLHLFVDRLERSGASDRVLWRTYDAVLGLHIFRGYRQALRPTD
jgi:glycosyltransferase involved in cell wall biosynthesis